MLAEAKKAKVATRLGVVDWRKVYVDVVGEQCVWDFRDLFLSAIALFREASTRMDFFGTDYTPEMVDAIVRDWSHTASDETSTMAMLDLFSSWLLQYPARDPLGLLLYDHAKAFAESVERNDPELMMSGPFVRWLLAKTSVEMPAPLRRRPDGVALEDFGALEVDLGRHMHLPVYVPKQHSKKPSWGFFFRRSTPEQRHVLEVAARTAQHLGDYHLQAEALKLLILQSEDPRDLMDTLAHLQLEAQGDKEGYITTCLSRYLAITDPTEEAELLQRLEKREDRPGMFDFEDCHNASLVWAWSAIRIMLRCSSMEGESGTNDNGRQFASFAARFDAEGIWMDEWRLPLYIVNFSRQELGISMLLSKRASDRPPPSSLSVYGRYVFARPETGPQPAQTNSGSQNGGVPQGSIVDIPNFDVNIPEGYVPYVNLTSQSTAPPAHPKTPYIPDAGLSANSTAPPVQTQHRQNSHEGTPARRSPREYKKEGVKSETAPSKKEEKRRASQEKREEAKATGNDDAGSFGETQQRPRQGQGREVHWNEAGFTEGQVGRRDEDEGKRRDNVGTHNEAGAPNPHDRRDTFPPKNKSDPGPPDSSDDTSDEYNRVRHAYVLATATRYMKKARAVRAQKTTTKEEEEKMEKKMDESEDEDEYDDEDEDEDEDYDDETDEQTDAEEERTRVRRRRREMDDHYDAPTIEEVD